MIQQTVTLPDKDYQLFLELVKHFSWEVDKQPVKTENTYLTPAIIAALDKRMNHFKINPTTAMDNDEVIKFLKQDDE